VPSRVGGIERSVVHVGICVDAHRQHYLDAWTRISMLAQHAAVGQRLQRPDLYGAPEESTDNIRWSIQ